MKILVTGGAGLVGSHVAEHYAQNGDEVIVLDNLMRSQLFGFDKETVEYNWNYLAKYNNIKKFKGDIRNEKDVLKVIGSGVDVVIHTAAQPGVPLSMRNPREDFSINAFGTFNVLECVRKRSKETTFIYCSTNKVYGENVDKISFEEKETRYIFKDVIGVAEKTPIDQTGHTPYGASKYVGDLYTQEYEHIYGMRTAVFRMSCIYGIRQFGFEDQGWVAWFTIATCLNKPITIYGNGKQARDLLYVGDLVEAFDAFIKSDLQGGIFNIGGGKDNVISLVELLDFLEKETGVKTQVTFANWRPSDQKVYVSDISRVKKQLGWQPRINLEKGLRKLIKWVWENKKVF